MSPWPGKFVIGLTGNIATGKSVVRKMLEHLGAYGIDADTIAHRAIARNAPGYQPVVETFGKYVVGSEGQIDRVRLGKLVFNDPIALEQLERIIHPLVIQAIDLLIRRSQRKVIVIEAIKLLESGLAEMCDSIWVVHASRAQQIARLVSEREMTEKMATLRINAQPPQEEKISRADVVINNEGSYIDAWQQVESNWTRLISKSLFGQPSGKEPEPCMTGLVVERAKPSQAGEIASFLSRLGCDIPAMSEEDILAGFGEKALLLLRFQGQICAMAGWKVENLVACTDDIIIGDTVNFDDAVHIMIDEVECVSRDLFCEVSLLFLSADLSDRISTFSALGYQRRTVDSLDVPAWKEAAVEKAQESSIMLFKQLRSDRVVRPV